MSYEMKKYLKRIMLFSSPFIIYLSVSLFIDPYNIIYEESNKKFVDLESKISKHLNFPLYKLPKYSDDPTDIILLGDSRTEGLNTETFDMLTNMRTTNLAYHGGTLLEIIETFWYAAGIHNLKQVYVGINFNLYNETNNMNRVSEAITLQKSPVSYLFSRYCIKSTYLIMKSLISNKTVSISSPLPGKEVLWKNRLDISANHMYRYYKYPKYYYNRLLEIVDYCEQREIKLVFFIPPTHVDLQQKVTEHQLNSEENIFKTDLNEFGLFYDFDYPNPITSDKNNYYDPFHFNDSIAHIIIGEIVSGNALYSRTSENMIKD